jgi:ADP-heptose:LPS heptosyltransferase
VTGALVIQTSFLGDVILTTPLIRELAKRGPVDVLVTPQGAAVLANNPDIRTIIRYDKRGTYGSALNLWQTVRDLRSRRPYATAYLAQGSFRSGLLAIMRSNESGSPAPRAERFTPSRFPTGRIAITPSDCGRWRCLSAPIRPPPTRFGLACIPPTKSVSP